MIHQPQDNAQQGQDLWDIAELAPPVAPLAMPKQVLAAEEGLARRVVMALLGRSGAFRPGIRRVN